MHYPQLWWKQNKKLGIWCFQLQSRTLSIMKVGGNGHYLQTQIITIFKAEKGPSVCPKVLKPFNSRTGTSSTDFNKCVISWQNVSLTNCKFVFHFHHKDACLPFQIQCCASSKSRWQAITITHMCNTSTGNHFIYTECTFSNWFTLAPTFRSYELKIQKKNGEHCNPPYIASSLWCWINFGKVPSSMDLNA